MRSSIWPVWKLLARWSGLLTHPRSIVAKRCSTLPTADEDKCKRETKEKKPTLPVPSLETTFSKFVRTARPFVKTFEFCKTRSLAREFIGKGGRGHVLQEALVERSKSTENWLTEWWTEHAFLAVRDPLVIFSSYAIVFPSQSFTSQDQWLQYSANLVLGALEYKTLIDDDKLPPSADHADTSGHRRLFGTCRIPKERCDTLSVLDSSEKPKHIVVAHNNHFFKVDVISECGEALQAADLVRLLHAIVKHSTCPAPAVGLFTGLPRDSWLRVCAQLLKGEGNCDSMATIEKSLFLLCLDQEVPPCTHACHMFHGGGSKASSGNRWFDKSLQLVVTCDGGAGMLLEQSAMDPWPAAQLADFLLKRTGRRDGGKCGSKGGGGGGCQAQNVCEPQPLTFNLEEATKQEIRRAEQIFDKFIKKFDLQTFAITDFGSKKLHSYGIGADQLVQVALQTAYYSLHCRTGAQHYTVSTQRYPLGRTDVVRTCCPDVLLFAHSTTKPGLSLCEKVALLQNAARCVGTMTHEAAMGHGIDRHLFGLQNIAKKKQLCVPLFEDNGYINSKQSTIYTWNIHLPRNAVAVLGPAVPDGYGVAYNIQKDCILLSVSTRGDDSQVDPACFREAFVNTMQTIGAMLQQQKLQFSI